MVVVIEEKLDISDGVMLEDEDFDNEQDWENMEFFVRNERVFFFFCRMCLLLYFGEKREDGSYIFMCIKCKWIWEFIVEDF